LYAKSLPAGLEGEPAVSRLTQLRLQRLGTASPSIVCKSLPAGLEGEPAVSRLTELRLQRLGTASPSRPSEQSYNLRQSSTPYSAKI